MKTFFVLFTIGILLSTALMSSDDSVILNENNHITFSGPVTEASVAQAQVKLGLISSKMSTKGTIYLVIDSPGGSVTDGNRFMDFAKSLPQTIKPICIFCASMGYHMFQSFDERIVYTSSTLMSHRASLGGIGGQIPGELESRLNWIKSILEIMDASVAKRVGLSKEAYQKLIYDELWLNGVDAVKTKHADKVAKIRCSQDLINGTKDEEVLTMFGPVKVKVSKCPLITGFLQTSFDKKVFRSESEAVREVKKTKRNVMWSF